MASVGEEEEEKLEYESDPEEAKLSLTMRRREASDDEGEEEEVDGRRMSVKRNDSRGSDCESDGEGAPEEYHDEESEAEEEELLEEYEEVEDEHQYADRESVGVVRAVPLEVNGDGGRSIRELSGTNQVEENRKEDNVGVYFQDEQFEENGSDGRGEGEKKENEPFAVPTAGAFYMYDDRFGDIAGGRHRRTLEGRKLWELMDERKWGHDKFEEMTMQERLYEEGRRVSRGSNRGRGKICGDEHGYQRGNMTKASNSNNRNNAFINQNKAPNNQNNAPKFVKGRGPRRYQPAWKTYNEGPSQNTQSVASKGRKVHMLLQGSSGHTFNTESDPLAARNHVLSSLNSASPPFYPSSSSSKEISLAQKKDGQTSATLQWDLQSCVTDESLSLSSSNTRRGENVADFVGMNKLYIDDSVSTYTGKPLTNLQDSGSSSTKFSQAVQFRTQGRGQNPLGQMGHQLNVPHNQVNRISNPSQLNTVQQAPVKTRGQATLQASAQQLGQCTDGGTQVSSSYAALMLNSFEPRGIDSPPESSKSRTAVVVKGKASTLSSGRGTFPYGRAQVMGASGNIGSSHGDQNFSGTPTFLPVMQFGGQQPGGVGVPAVGMAFPRYVGNPGSGNSEMTWLPVLAGAAGALGTYCSPYLSVDGAYHALPSGQIPSLPAASSKEDNMNRHSNELKPSQKSELVNNEFGQRLNKARRYTEMKFDR